jgi:hypothetical protein
VPAGTRLRLRIHPEGGTRKVIFVESGPLQPLPGSQDGELFALAVHRFEAGRSLVIIQAEWIQ